MADEREGTLAWYRADLEARRAALNRMLESPTLSGTERDLWEERLADVEVVLSDIENDPLGYMTWLLADRHATLRRQTDRFAQ